MIDETAVRTLFRERGDDLAKSVVAHQRALHEIPELAFQEKKTARYVAGALLELGVEAETELAGTGLLAEVAAGSGGPTVLVRADMDGLPIDEDRSHEPRSHHDGVMHACGHDGHMSIALGVVEAVKRGLGEVDLPGRLLVLFQPAEETGAGGGSGAERLVRSGLLDRAGVDYVLGLHLWSPLEIGRAIVPDRTVMAASDEIDIEIHGPGGHAAMPHLASDVVLAASQIVVALQSVVARGSDPVSPAVLSIGEIHAGSAPNVLPREARLRGTLRTPDAPTREALRERISTIVRGVAESLGVTAKVEFGSGYPATVNSPAVAAVVRSAAEAVLGPESVAEGPPTMAAEDFSFLLERRPGAFMLLGTRDPSCDAIHPHHSPRFSVSPRALPAGVEILLSSAVRLMHAR